MDSETIIQQEHRPALATAAEVAGRLELWLTRPDLHEDVVDAACRRAVEAGLASAVVRPSDVDMAVRILAETPVATASVVGFPHGTSNTAAKLYEGRDLLRRGAKELCYYVNHGKMVSRQFRHVETELEQISESCRQSSAVLTIVYDSRYMAEDMKIILCKIGKRVEAKYIATDSQGDVALLKTIAKGFIEVKCAGNSLEQFEAGYAAGAERFLTPAPFALLAAWSKLHAPVET